ncbi:uncharacterized protein TRUGW13939_10717 [Talaromyces rugulosus]|uniref:V-type proton ATPase subunit C n=1 Tax=Talaromyces rugulosus TaxID=121627 RepID=A0A7H8RB56_TALRU|nr:uncharacterized protein TRUGW13939_10717 [Talaromyces rugulosus]QKX63546.1 hypothetical protein TRUGW13939_10717 [Talaromyces rugulosus]
MADSEYSPKFAPFFSFVRAASRCCDDIWRYVKILFSLVLRSTVYLHTTAMGAAYGTAKSGIGIAGIGQYRPDLIMKSLIPVVMSGIIAVYGLVIAVLISGALNPPPTQNTSLYTSFMHLGSGLSVGLAGLAAGYTIGIVGDAGVRAYMQQSRVYVGMILILIFGEVLGLYGLIVGLILNSRSGGTSALRLAISEIVQTLRFKRTNFFFSRSPYTTLAFHFAIETCFVVTMATETVQPTTHEEGTNGDLTEPGAQYKCDGNNADQEKQQISSVLVSPKNPSDGYAVADSPGVRHLGESSHGLSVYDFELIKTLGTGTFARVWLTRLKNSPRKDKVYALKILRKADVIKLKQVEHVRNERRTLAAVAGHPFITSMITTFSDEQSLYMLLEYCPGGEIFSYLRRARSFNEATSKFYAAEITMIIQYLHDVQGVAYRDLKPENILLGADGHIKLVDFGFAKQVGNRETYTLCGTPDYLAPEVIHNCGHGLAVDWWALGILIYEFLVGQPPFWDQNVMRLYEQIVEGRLRFPQTMSPAARDIISQLCKTDVTKRLGHIQGGAARVKAHPWFDSINWDDLYYRRIPGPIIPRVGHVADAANFEEYPPPPHPDTLEVYTDDMREKYEPLFSDF